MMEQFSKHFDSLQAAILSTETDDNVGQHCQCQGDAALYRCIDCSFSPILCGACIIASHASDPFHRMQKWNGLCFHRISLLDLGQTVQLGHHGAPCPNRLPGSTGRSTTVIHINGIHQVCIEYCHCIPVLPKQSSWLNPLFFRHPLKGLKLCLHSMS